MLMCPIRELGTLCSGKVDGRGESGDVIKGRDRELFQKVVHDFDPSDYDSILAGIPRMVTRHTHAILVRPFQTKEMKRQFSQCNLTKLQVLIAYPPNLPCFCNNFITSSKMTYLKLSVLFSELLYSLKCVNKSTTAESQDTLTETSEFS